MALTRYELEENTAVVHLDDGKANALSPAMITELFESLDRAEREAKALVLVGRPERFSAGFDLKIMMSSPDEARALLRRGAELLMRVYGSPLPVVVACTGHAIAAGALLLLTADVRFGAAGAYRIGLNETSIGMPLPILGMELARDRITTTELGRATLRAQMYAPEEAARVGFLDEAIPPGELLGRAKAEAQKLGALSRMAYHATKSRLRRRTIDHIVSTLEEDLAAIEIGAQT